MTSESSTVTPPDLDPAPTEIRALPGTSESATVTLPDLDIAPTEIRALPATATFDQGDLFTLTENDIEDLQ
ncbi:hypothetical protein [Nocardia sp. NPDC058497]|uniref:hypothetical protein n=1 Tax=Nocardia sp. NPDC058497 TaxID=3346529 RepID=UPI00365A6E6C